MDLLQVIIPSVNKFFILLEDGEKVPILKYEKIDINFCDRIVIINGKSEKFQNPVITYRVDMTEESKKKLSGLFDTMSNFNGTVQTKRSRIVVGRDKYEFNVDITAIPTRLIDRCGYSRGLGYDSEIDGIKICLKLENTKISLFDDAEEAYEKYTRFELLDL